MFRCRACRRTCNERTDTPFNHLQAPTDVAVLVVPGRLQYKLSLRNVAEMVRTRGFTFTHETPAVCHRTSRYMNNRIKQDHRGIKQRYYPMRGFGSSRLRRPVLHSA